jgi:hypothetical protein
MQLLLALQDSFHHSCLRGQLSLLLGCSRRRSSRRPVPISKASCNHPLGQEAVVVNKGLQGTAFSHLLLRRGG